MRNLSKSELQEIINYSTHIQNQIAARTDGQNKFNSIQMMFFKSLYKTAWFYLFDRAGYVVNGVPMLDYAELVQWYDVSLPEIKKRRALKVNLS